MDNGQLSPRFCKSCGRRHSREEIHDYVYASDVDKDLTCSICLLPLVAPRDLPCGHCFCEICIRQHLNYQENCPLDRRPITFEECKPTNLALKRILDKLAVKCPFSEQCGTEEIGRGALTEHLRTSCAGMLSQNLQDEPSTSSGTRAAPPPPGNRRDVRLRTRPVVVLQRLPLPEETPD